MDFSNLWQAMILLVVGMGIVYSFLWLLVFMMTISAKVIPHFSYILPDDEPKKKARPAAPAASSDDTAIALAIAVAQSR